MQMDLCCKKGKERILSSKQDVSKRIHERWNKDPGGDLFPSCKIYYSKNIFICCKSVEFSHETT